MYDRMRLFLTSEVQNSGELGICKYGEKCTFAYNQLEIDVWTEERKGTLDRNLLFETTADKLDPVISIIRLLQEHKGVFMFLCQVSTLISCYIYSYLCNVEFIYCLYIRILFLTPVSAVLCHSEACILCTVFL